MFDNSQFFVSGGAAWSAPVYSLDFQSANAAYMQQTFSTPTLASKWTFSTWLKIGSTGANKMVFTAGVDIVSYDYIQINSSGAILIFHGVVGSTAGYVFTGNVITSTTTWYHLTVKFDGSAAASNRVTVYLNGTAQSLTVSTAWPSGGGYINTAIAHGLAVRYRPPSSYDAYYDGLLYDTHFIDGQSLDYSSFYDAGSPIEYTGTYGTNGFHLEYSDNSTVAALGTDTSGNANDWTVTNVLTTDQSTDIP